MDCHITNVAANTGVLLDDRARLLGEDPATGAPVRLLWGRYGWYLELGEAPMSAAGAASQGGEEEQQLAAATGSAPAAAEDAGNGGPAAGRGRPGRKKKAVTAAAAKTKPKPTRAALGRSADTPDISLEDALQLLAWPKVCFAGLR